MQIERNSSLALFVASDEEARRVAVGEREYDYRYDDIVVEMASHEGDLKQSHY